MIIREAKISYNTIGESTDTAIDQSEKVASYLRRYMHLKDLDVEVEHFFVIALNRKNFPKGVSVVTTGTNTSSLVHPREVFKHLVLQSAAAFVVAHNHPSGDPAPSRADIQVTRQLREASKVMGIDFLDHVIVGERSDDPQGLGFYSFNEAGLI